MRSLRLQGVVCALPFVNIVTVSADDIRELKLRDWEPQSMLVTKTTLLEKPRLPVIDIHNHLSGGRQFLTPERVQLTFE